MAVAAGNDSLAPPGVFTGNNSVAELLMGDRQVSVMGYAGDGSQNHEPPLSWCTSASGALTTLEWLTDSKALIARRREPSSPSKIHLIIG